MLKKYLRGRKKFDAHPLLLDMLSRARIIQPVKAIGGKFAAMWCTHADHVNKKDRYESTILSFDSARTKRTWTPSGYCLCFHRFYDALLMAMVRDIIPESGPFYIYIAPDGEPGYTYDEEHCCHPQVVCVWSA